VYNYNTLEKVKEFEAHSDFIRSIAIHPKDPLMLSCSDDQTISLWDIEKGFTLVRSYEEHKNFVMKLAINSKDYNMFASASMDHKVKIWSFTSANSHLTLDGHTKGATAVAFCPLNDKPYLASGSDDKSIKIWDYTNKHCVFTFEGHEENISSLCFHPELPILISGAEDNTCKFWNINVFKLEESKMQGYDTIWDIATQPSQNMIALGCEQGIIVMRMGSDQPLATFK
jgi:coatomer subunit beta'